MASNDTGISRAMVKAVFEGLIQEIEQMVLNGHTIQLGELGTLKFSISCKSVEDKDDLSTDLIKRRRILFQPSTRLKTAVKNVQFQTTVIEDSEDEEQD
ncbi:MAG: HU family DNA-binding protein [Bacteroidaceae bacterium]|nr:HU family DNA-binding protein [Bacteroidaceae bacterium]